MRIPEINQDVSQDRMQFIDGLKNAYDATCRITLVKYGDKYGKFELCESMIAAMIAAASTVASAMVYVDTKTKPDNFELANLLIRTANNWAENQKLRN